MGRGEILAVLVVLGAAGDDQGPKPERIEAGGIENLFRVSPRLYSGGQPQGDAAFRALARLGVQTIITVDGASPDVEAARRHGLRYVHLPIGYDGLPREQAVRLVKAVETLPGPVYIHCHHGKHRGPTAVAACGLATEGWSRKQARAWLEVAGTAAQYRGLFASVDAFRPPSADELERIGPADLPERAEVGDLVSAMVRVDQHWDHLVAVRRAGFRPPADSPDVDPLHEALMLAEQFRECARPDAPMALGRGAPFAAQMQAAARESAALDQALRAFRSQPTAPARTRVESAFDAVQSRCAACHARFRDTIHRP